MDAKIPWSLPLRAPQWPCDHELISEACIGVWGVLVLIAEELRAIGSVVERVGSMIAMSCSVTNGALFKG
jgi:hypothetical protein